MTKAKIRTETPNLGVYKAAKPFKHEGLSGVVVITDDWGDGLSYIQFKDQFLNFVACKMPRGVGPAEQVYIHVMQMVGHWAVWGVYLESEKSTLLWRQADCPDWIGYIKRP